MTDFGLARAVDGAKDDATGERVPSRHAAFAQTLTEEGALLGTPAYMSPEQLRAEEADARSDQFSFCVSLWEGLSGKRPFHGSTIGELQSAIAAGPKGTMRAKVPVRIVRALRRGLSQDPDDRFDSMTELLGALSPNSRRTWLFALGGAGVCAAAFALAFSAARTTETDVCAPSRDAIDSSWNDARRADVLAAFGSAEGAPDGGGPAVVQGLDRWADAHALARYDACTATHLRHEQSERRLDERVACLDRGRVALDALVGELLKGDRQTLALAPEAVAQLPVIEQCSDARLSRAGGALAPPAAVAARVLAIERELARGRVLLATAQLGAARAAAEAAVADARAAGYLPVVARAELLRADALRAAAEYVAAEAAARAALLAAEESGDETSIVAAWLALAATEGELGGYPAAAEHVRHADAVVARLDRPDTLEVLVRGAMGAVRYNLGEHEAARHDLDAALDLARRLHGHDAPQVAKILTNLGNLARAEGKLDEALALHRRALALDSERYGPDHPLLGRHHHNVAGVLRLTSAPADALPEYQRALAIKEAALGEHPDVALTENSLGLYHAARGDLPTAARHYQRALSIYERHGHGTRAMVLYNLGLLRLQSSDGHGALAHFRAARAIDERRLGPHSLRVADEWIGEANALRMLARVDDAAPAQASSARPPPPAPPPQAPPPPASVSSPPPEPSARPTRPAPPMYGAGQAWD